MNDVQGALARALEHHKAGRLAEAEQAYCQIRDADPTNPDAWHFLGLIAYQRGNEGLAVQRIGHALGLAPDNPSAHTNLGIALAKQGKLAEAVAAQRRALALNPDFPEALNNLGLALKELEDPYEAAKCFERALALVPCRVQFQHNLGLVLHEQGRFGEAYRAHDRAIQLDPQRAPAHWCRSVLTLMRGDFEAGWPEFEWRWKTGWLAARDFAVPRWSGEELE